MNTPICHPSHAVAQPTARGALRRRWRTQLAAAALIGAASFVALPTAQAQVVNPLGAVRNFPDAAERGTLTILGVQEARLNSRDIRMAPGMRLFSPQNTLVPRHTVIGQTYKANYVPEASTGLLHAAAIRASVIAAEAFFPAFQL